MRDDFLTQTLGQTYQYGKVVKPEVKQKTPAVSTGNTGATNWAMPQTTLTRPTVPQNLFQMAHPVTQTANTTTPINVSATQQAKDEPVKYTFSGFDKTWGDRMQSVYDHNNSFDYSEMAGDDNVITLDEFKAWQGKHSLTPDGKIGYNTLNAMYNGKNDYSKFNWVKKPGQANTNTGGANGQTSNSRGGGTPVTTPSSGQTTANKSTGQKASSNQPQVPQAKAATPVTVQRGGGKSVVSLQQQLQNPGTLTRTHRENPIQMVVTALQPTTL